VAISTFETLPILATDALAALIDQIEQEDRTRIKAKTDILKD
jgi:hypothetical protein